MISLANGALIARPLITHEFIGLNVAHSQSVRWRKPLWLGTAKSKIFRVPVRPVIPEEDKRELMRLHNNYRTYTESLRKYFMAVAAQNMVQFDEEVVKAAEEKMFVECSKLNDEWNKEVAKSREEREAIALAARKESVLAKLIDKEKRDEKIMGIVEETVRKVKAEVHTFITEETIDQAIEEALGTVVNYNAAIDANGNKYEGVYVPVEKDTKARFRADQ